MCPQKGNRDSNLLDSETHDHIRIYELDSRVKIVT